LRAGDLIFHGHQQDGNAVIALDRDAQLNALSAREFQFA